MEEPTLACPSCRRDYEIPHKCARPDDVEYLPVPRMLSCLHTVCQSCLQDMRERSTTKSGLCPICRQEQVIENVANLPLDVTILKNILINSKADLMSFCSRCYDEVPAYSWCHVCSTALCEFHHQDHKLSMDTSKHGLQTFKDISYQKLHIEPKLPAISCPEIDKQECTAYCHDCKHLISVHGVLQNHSAHRTEDCLHGYHDMRARLTMAHDRADSASKELKVAVRGVRNRMQELDNECSRATKQIEDEFDALRRLINSRETALMERLRSLADRKRGVLVSQLNKFSEHLEECYLTSDISGTVLRDTDDMRSSSQEAAYLVGLTDTLENKMAQLDASMKGMTMTPNTDAEIAVSFNLSEIAAVQVNVPILGCIQTSEDPGVMGKDEKRGGDVGPLHSKHKSLHKPQHIVQTHSPVITFTIKSEPVPTVIDAVAGNADKGTQLQSLVIEARGSNSYVEEGVAGNSKAHGQGPLLGQVLLITEVDKKLASRHEVRSFFESVVIRNVPILRITKEYVPTANIFKNNSPDHFERGHGDAHARGRLDGRDRAAARGDRDRSSSLDHSPDSHAYQAHDVNLHSDHTHEARVGGRAESKIPHPSPTRKDHKSQASHDHVPGRGTGNSHSPENRANINEHAVVNPHSPKHKAHNKHRHHGHGHKHKAG